MHFSGKIVYSLIFSGIFSCQGSYAQNAGKNESALFGKYKNDRSLLPDFSYVGCPVILVSRETVRHLINSRLAIWNQPVSTLHQHHFMKHN